LRPATLEGLRSIVLPSPGVRDEQGVRLLHRSDAAAQRRPIGASRRLLRHFGGDLLRQALAERQTQRVLFDAVAAALDAGDAVAKTLRTGADAPPADVLAKLHEGLRGRRGRGDRCESDGTPGRGDPRAGAALWHAGAGPLHALVEGLRELLDDATGAKQEARG